MAIANGVSNIQWLMLMTMLVLLAITPLFGWITTRFKTRQFLSYCTVFFAAHLVIFFFLFSVEERSPWTTRAFFIWVNVFNMFIVSLFWSFMNDVYSQGQSKRLFAFIAAGGTAGAISGPIITSSLVEAMGLAPLLLISAFVLTCSVLCIGWLTRWQNVDFKPLNSNQKQTHMVRNEALKGSIWGGMLLIIRSPYLSGICLFVVLYAISITFVEIQQAELVENTYSDPAQRTKLFSMVDFSVNVLALIFQLLLTSRMIQWFGFRATLLVVPVGITIGFGLMATMPMLAVMIGVEIFRRSGDYSIMKPAREMLFSVVTREEKYKAKNFIDTAILRTGNTSSAWAYTGLKSIGAAGASMVGISLALGLAWCATAYWLGGQFVAKQQTNPK
ncbi:MAG: AAA family ATP:ADP antiporter [Cryomorphaceae bacterium]|jgi:AAA family ATP:ADP antiporter